MITGTKPIVEPAVTRSSDSRYKCSRVVNSHRRFCGRGDGQLRCQPCAPAPLALPHGRCARKLFECRLDGTQVAVDRLVKQAHLLDIELLAAPARRRAYAIQVR